jgi:hypothetical protein
LRIHASRRIFCARLWSWRTSCVTGDLSPAPPAAASFGGGTRKCNLHAQLPGDRQESRSFRPRHFSCLVWPRLYREGVVALSRPQAAWWVCLCSARFHERGRGFAEEPERAVLDSLGGAGHRRASGFTGLGGSPEYPASPKGLFSLVSPCRIVLSLCNSFALFQEMQGPGWTGPSPHVSGCSPCNYSAKSPRESRQGFEMLQPVLRPPVSE